MEVAIGTNGNTPFQREVREWQRIDPNTGALLTGRLEADRWINGPLNTYGKVVDSQNISQPNGTQQSQRKQLELYQARTLTGGSMQVIRSQTVQRTSSRWPSSPNTKISNSSNNQQQNSVDNITNSNNNNQIDKNLIINGDNHNNNNYQNNNNNNQNQNHKMLTAAPSLKLSNLMKSSNNNNNNCNGGGINLCGSEKNNLHYINNNNNNINSMSPPLIQQNLQKTEIQRKHQQQHDTIIKNDINKLIPIKLPLMLQQQQYTTNNNLHDNSNLYEQHLLLQQQQHKQQQQQQQQQQQHQQKKQLPPTTLDLNHRVGGVVDFNYNDVKEQKNSMINKFTKENENDFYLQRGRSVSTDDLATDWNENNHNNNNNNNNDNNNLKDESSEWRRVSKIRRSFQFPSPNTIKTTNSNLIIQSSSSTTTRPIDLPENSVSVSKIRNELENGRRLNTAMRNNNINLAALDTILNGNNNNNNNDIDLTTSTLSRKKEAFLTSESLKEIKGKLKKLSDESLYKDDFISNDCIQLNINNDNNNKQINDEKLNINDNKSTNYLLSTKINSINNNNGDNNNLENRSSSRFKDTLSAEWHLRRKSYGFEKMTPQDDNNNNNNNKTMMYRQETSTDSGIGRSSELNNWSPPPTTTTTKTTESKGTIIAFGEQQSRNSTTVVLNGIHENNNENNNTSQPKIPLINRRYRPTNSINTLSDSNEMKRHSIAVDETKYVRDNLRKVFDTKTSIHLNGFYSSTNDNNINLVDEITKQQQRKRVEFCKTEVHFAAESGRVNIVETDGKPPPTNNFRRRRRSSGNTYLDAITSGLQIMHFGDEKKATILEQESELLTDDLQTLQNNVTVTVPIVNGIINNKDGGNSSIIKNILDEIEQDEISLRGILKNKPIKPKPYHLGENIDTSEKFWGVKLKPVIPGNETDGIFDNILNGNNCDSEKPDITNIGGNGDHVKIVEERKNGTGYSTKINLSLTDGQFEWNTNSESIKPLISTTNNTIDKKIDFTKNSSHLISNNNNNNNQNNNKHKNEEQCLKSTSLIMQQIRSNLNQIDDVKYIKNDNQQQKPLKCSSSPIISNATKLISNMTAITKSNSANSIFLEKQRQIYNKPKYSSSLDGDMIINEPITYYGSNIMNTNQNIITDNLSYNNIQQQRNMTVLCEEPQKDHDKKPIPKPRIKMIGTNGYGGFESDDSAKADEEVKNYLIGSDSNKICNMENELKGNANEMFGSWSRIKAQRFVQKSKVILKEVPQSNIMSIELRSPESSLKKLPLLNSQDIKTTKQVPIAKPRTTVKSSLSPENIQLTNQKIVENKNSYPQRYETKNIINEFLPVVKEPLKIVTATNGARKLREHELSYFGVKLNTDDSYTQRITTNQNFKNNINNHKNIEIIPNVVSSKWKLSNDKPDLLRHGPVDKPSSPIVINLNDQNTNRNIIESAPIYENLQPSSKYNRNKDLDHDEKNLSEMSETAELTLKAVTDRQKLQAQKYQQRHEMHPSKPLDTIDEKRSTRTYFDLESEEKFKTSPSLSTDSFQRKCCSRRSSSASSTGSISDSGSIHKTSSRSRSRENLDSNNIKKSTLSTAVAVRPRTEHRSSSRDSQKSHNNSLENYKLSSTPQKIERKIKRTVTSHTTPHHNNDKPEPMPRNRRDETKTKSSTERKESNRRHGDKSIIDKSLSNKNESNDHRQTEKSLSERKDIKIHRHSEKSSIDRKESSRHLREKLSNDVDSIDRHKQSSRSSTSRTLANDSHKHNSSRSSRDSKDPSNIRSSQRSANNRTEISDNHNMKIRTDSSHDRHRSQERHKNSSNTRSSNGKSKVATSSMDQKHRSVRSPGGSNTTTTTTTIPTIVNSMTKTSSSRHHRSRKDHPRK